MEITRLESETLEECNQRKRKEEEDDRKKEEARKRKEEDDRKKEEARQRKEEAQKEEHVEHARQRKKEQEGQAPKARGKYMTFDDRMEDLKRFKETHDHANVSIRENKSLYLFCASVRNARKTGKGIKLTDERIAACNAMGFNWTSQEHVTRSFNERIEDLEEYKQTHGHLNMKRDEDNSLYQFCAEVRHSLKQFLMLSASSGEMHNNMMLYIAY